MGDIKRKLFEYLDFHSDLNVKIFIELNLLWTEHIWERDCFTIKMNWFMRKKSLKPSLMNLIKPLLKCRVTKCSETENFTQLLMSLYSVILIFKTGMTKFFIIATLSALCLLCANSTNIKVQQLNIL